MSDDEVLSDLDWEYPPKGTPEEREWVKVVFQSQDAYWRDPENIRRMHIWLGNMIENLQAKKDEDDKWES